MNKIESIYWCSKCNTVEIAKDKTKTCKACSSGMENIGFTESITPVGDSESAPSTDSVGHIPF